MRSREEIYRQILNANGENPGEVKAELDFSLLEILLDIRELLQNHKVE